MQRLEKEQDKYAIRVLNYNFILYKKMNVIQNKKNANILIF